MAATRRMGVAGTLGMLALLPLHGCGKVGREVAREVAQASSDEVKAAELQPVTEQEAHAFAEQMLKAAAAGDAAAIERLIDFPTLVNRALTGARLPKQVVADTAAGVAAGARQTGVVAQLAGMQAAGTTLSLLSTRLDRGGRWVSFRALPPAGGFEHYDFLLTKRPDKAVVAADAFFLSSGEQMSISMRRLLIGAFAADKSFLERLSAEENLFVKHLPDLNRVRQAQASGQSEQALALLDALPEGLRNQKFALLLRLQMVAKSPEDPRYAQTVATLVEKFPKDPAAALASIDHHFLKKEYDKALAAVVAVEKASVPDPYFGVLKSNALAAAGKYAEAKQVALATIQQEPGLLPAHMGLVAVLLQQKDHAATADQLLKMRDQFGLSYEFEGVPEYAAFLASAEYPAFKRKLDGN